MLAILRSRKVTNSQHVPAVGVLLLAVFIVLIQTNLSQARAERVEYVTAISTRLNPTGQPIVFPVPINDSGAKLDDVVIKVLADDSVLVEKSQFIARLSGTSHSSIDQAISALQDQSGFVPIADFATAGVDLRFDSELQELVMSLALDQRSSRDLSIGGQSHHVTSTNLIAPEFISGYLNVTSELHHLWDENNIHAETTSGRLELESVVSVGGIVLENSAAYDGDVDSAICPIEAYCSYGHVSGFKRQSTRLIYDLPDDSVRAVVGDTDSLNVPLQRSIDLLGVSLEHSDQKFRPGQTVTSRGVGSFRIERAATVDIVVNGSVVQTMRLRPGNYNLRDLPLSTGANDIDLVITDETGQQQLLSINAYSDPSLLRPTQMEWAVAAGVPSYVIDDQRAYDSQNVMGTGYIRYGLSDALTGQIDLQADDEVLMAGLGFNFATPVGLFGIHGAGSTGVRGDGAAADISWRLNNFQMFSDGRDESLQFNGEYRSTDFRTPGEFLSLADGIYYPEFNYWLRLSGSYSFPFDDQISATISGRYQFSDDDRDLLSPYTITGDRYGTDLTLSKPLTQTAHASLLIGYSNELYVRNFEHNNNTEPDFRIALRLNLRPSDTVSVAASYDTLGNQSNVSAYQAEGNGIGRWDTNLNVQNRAHERTASVNASAGYFGNRAELRLSHYADAQGVGFDSLTGDQTRQRTSLRVGTAVAFAGDKIAVGPPIRGGAFAVVAPHNSLADKEIIVGNLDHVRAKADMWGNALITDVPAYLPGSMSVDVADLPIGYSLGSGVFETYAPYKSGYAIEVGSAASISAYGTLVDDDGAPIALLTGIATNDKRPGHTVHVFTNAQGRFGAEGLTPGRWTIDMHTEGAPTQFVLNIPDDGSQLIKTGVLVPDARAL
jgi:outer membrane usher protein